MLLKLRGIYLMNNRGQSLISFVLIVPIILLILFMVYDIGNMVLLKEQLDNINYLVIDYGLDKLNDIDLNNKLTEMINKNKDDIDKIEININDGEIKILLEDKIENRLSLINKLDVLDIKSNYIGYIQDDKKIIRKDK